MLTKNDLAPLNYADVKDWSPEQINAFLIREYGAPLQIDFPQHTAPIYDEHGEQRKDSNGKLRTMHHMLVEALNAHTTLGLTIDSATTSSDIIAPHAHNLLASDVFIATADNKMVLELRTKFGPASQVAPSTVLISSGGFAKHKPDGTGDKPEDIALRETFEELGLQFTADDLIKTHKTAGVANRLAHYPKLTLTNGREFQGVRPSVCVQYLARSPMMADDLADRVRLNWESDAIIVVDIKDAIKLWSGVNDVADILVFPSLRNDLKTLYLGHNPSLQSMFANARQIPAERSDRHSVTLLPQKSFLYREDSMINGSTNPVSNLLRVARLA